MVKKSKWEKATKWESDWWGNCANTFSEETKQLTYAKKMGLEAEFINGKYPVYDLKGKSVFDIGGGPVSMLLKCVNFEKLPIIYDPCNYPKWIEERYLAKGINLVKAKGEDDYSIFSKCPFDEVWIYNVLQHTENPELIIKNALNVCKIIRIFEWVYIPESDGHIQVLTKENLDKWLGGDGKLEQLNENYCKGIAYYGVFKGNHYEKI